MDRTTKDQLLKKEQQAKAIVDQRSRGLGDTIARMTTAIGIPPCGGCKKRQERLNKLVPYRSRHERARHDTAE